MNCIKCGGKDEVYRYGSYRRKSDARYLQRFKCKRCQITYSHGTKEPAYNQKRRDINHTLMLLLASGISMRRSAIILGVNRSTVSAKLLFLGAFCRFKNGEFLEKQSMATQVQFDELQTIEHSKCKPLSVSVIVNKETRHILGIRVAKMPATGHLAAIATEKYGNRPDHRVKELRYLCSETKHLIAPTATIQSDKAPYYRGIIKQIFPKADYSQYKRHKNCIAGQGELKKTIKDPLFHINHTLAMLRANVKRLVRKTWCTTKKWQRLMDHLSIYSWVHNYKLV